MADSLAAVVLAAGAGERLAPLTRLLPKALCPVDNVALVDHALRRVSAVVDPAVAAPDAVAVNVHHGAPAMLAHLAARDVYVSHERDVALGTAGAVGALRPWLDGRPVVVVNADTWTAEGLRSLVEGWDGERIRVLVAGGGAFGPRAAVVASVLPWTDAARLEAVPTGLYEVCWRDAHRRGRLEVVALHGLVVDCGTPRRYLEANLAASGGRSVVHPDAHVDGDPRRLVRTVVWAGARVGETEQLTDAIRAPGPHGAVTVLVR